MDNAGSDFIQTLVRSNNLSATTIFMSYETQGHKVPMELLFRGSLVSPAARDRIFVWTSLAQPGGELFVRFLYSVGNCLKIVRVMYKTNKRPIPPPS